MNKDILYSTGNSTQYTVIIYMKRVLKRMSICITELLCRTQLSNNTGAEQLEPLKATQLCKSTILHWNFKKGKAAAVFSLQTGSIPKQTLTTQLLRIWNAFSQKNTMTKRVSFAGTSKGAWAFHNQVKWKGKCHSLSRVLLFATLWTTVRQAPLSMGFSRQEYWSRLPFPSPGDLPNPGIKSCLLLGRQIFYHEPPGKP